MHGENAVIWRVIYIHICRIMTVHSSLFLVTGLVTFTIRFGISLCFHPASRGVLGEDRSEIAMITTKISPRTARR